MTKGTATGIEHLTKQNCFPWNLDELPEHIAIIMDGNGRWAEFADCLALPAIKKALSRSGKS